MYVISTREAAERSVSGDIVGSFANNRVYLVILGGHFVYEGASVPLAAGAQTPTGSYVTFTIDARTHDALDIGIQQTAPDLAGLGRVWSFELPSR